MQLPLLAQETPDRLLVVVPGGAAARSAVHRCPSHPSASTLSGPEGAPVRPTATQLSAVAQETLDSTPPAGSAAGVASVVQLVPSHAAASVTRGLPAELEA